MQISFNTKCSCWSRTSRMYACSHSQMHISKRVYIIPFVPKHRNIKASLIVSLITCWEEELVTWVFRVWFWRDTFLKFSITEARSLALPLGFRPLLPSRLNSGIWNNNMNTCESWLCSNLDSKDNLEKSRDNPINWQLRLMSTVEYVGENKTYFKILLPQFSDQDNELNYIFANKY